MALVFRVATAFSRKDPATGALVEYQAGAIIARQDLIDDVRASEHRAHGHMTNLPDDHHAVLPHLAEDHPAVATFMANVAAGQEPETGVRARTEPDAEAEVATRRRVPRE